MEPVEVKDPIKCAMNPCYEYETQNMFTIYFSWWRNQVENFRVPTTSAKVKVVTAGRAFRVWNNKDSTFQFKLPSGVCTADVTFIGTSGVHKFLFTSDSAKAFHVVWDYLDYDHTADAFLLGCTFTHHGKHPRWWNCYYPM